MVVSSFRVHETVVRDCIVGEAAGVGMVESVKSVKVDTIEEFEAEYDAITVTVAMSLSLEMELGLAPVLMKPVGERIDDAGNEVSAVDDPKMSYDDKSLVENEVEAQVVTSVSFAVAMHRSKSSSA